MNPSKTAVKRVLHRYRPPDKRKQTAPPGLFPGLRKFEVSIIARYLTAREKLKTMALLNRQWNELVNKHYAWSRFPEIGPFTIREKYWDFFQKLKDFTGIQIPKYEPYWSYEQKYFKHFLQARSIGFYTMSCDSQLCNLYQNALLLSKICRLKLYYSIQKLDRVFDILCAPQFWQNLAHLQYLELDFNVEFNYDQKEKILYRISLKPLQQLSSLKISIGYTQKQIKENRNYFFKPNTLVTVQIADIPASVVELTLSDGQYYVSDQQIRPLLKLTHFEYTFPDKTLPLLDSKLQSLKLYNPSCLRQQIPSHLISLEFLQINKVFKIQNLPLLRTLVPGEIKQYSFLVLSKLPSLELIILNVQRLVINGGMKIGYAIVSRQDTKIVGVSYHLEYNGNIENYKISNLFLKGVNLTLLEQTQLTELKNRNYPLEVLKLGGEVSRVQFNGSQLQNLFIMEQIEKSINVYSLVLSSPKLSYVGIQLLERTLNLQLQSRIHTLNIKCRQLSLQGKGSMIVAKLDIQRLKLHPNYGLLSSIKVLYLSKLKLLSSILKEDKQWKLKNLLKLYTNWDRLLSEKTIIEIRARRLYQFRTWDQE